MITSLFVYIHILYPSLVYILHALPLTNESQKIHFRNSQNFCFTFFFLLLLMLMLMLMLMLLLLLWSSFIFTKMPNTKLICNMKLVPNVTHVHRSCMCYKFIKIFKKINHFNVCICTRCYDYNRINLIFFPFCNTTHQRNWYSSKTYHIILFSHHDILGFN